MSVSGKRDEQLALLDPYDDGLDFGTWMENLPKTPEAPPVRDALEAVVHGNDAREAARG